MVDDLRTDVRYTLRLFRKNAAFTAIAVAMLAVGIGVNTGVFTLTSAILFKGFPRVERNDRLVYISSRGYGCCASYPDFRDWRAQAKSFDGMAAVHGVGVIVTDADGFPERYDATEITTNTFGLIGQQPFLGRDFAAADEAPGANRVAILSYSFWQRRFGGDRTILGRTIRIDGNPASIVGVMPEGFSFPQQQDFWLPLVSTPELERREARDLWFAVGRMSRGVSRAEAAAEMATIGKRLAQEYPLTNQDQLPVVQTFAEFFLGRNASAIYGAMWAAVGFVLLIACANLANLLLARSMGRSREIAVRLALGASRWRVVRQLLIESVMLSVLGGAAGWWIAGWGIRVYAAAMAYKSPWLIVDYTMDVRVFAYLAAVSIGVGILFGLAPAIRLSSLDVNLTTRAGALSSGPRRWLSAALVATEMALALVLLGAAGVMIRSFLNIYTADIGISTGHLLTASIGLPPARYPDRQVQAAFFDRLERRLGAVAGVESIAIASSIPTHGSLKLRYQLAGTAPVDARRRPTLSAVVIGPAYFQTLGTSVVSGRPFSEFDGPAARPVAIVNERFARASWPGVDPLGKQLRMFSGDEPGAWLTVVGVAPNIDQNDITRQMIDPVVYVPFAQRPGGTMWVLARTRVPPAGLATAFRREVQALDADLPMFGPFTLAERLDTWNYWSSGINGGLFLVFAAIALLLAAIGLYAVIAHAVGQRTQEIGLRIAIGATGADILALVFAQGMVPLGAGTAIGLAGSAGVNRVLQSVLVRVSPSDWISLASATLVLVAAAALGCWIPARSAMRIDPAVALRQE